jgi:hypothetical protein
MKAKADRAYKTGASRRLTDAEVAALFAAHQRRQEEMAEAVFKALDFDRPTRGMLHRAALDLLRRAEYLRLQDYAAAQLASVLKLAAAAPSPLDIVIAEKKRMGQEADRRERRRSKDYGIGEVRPRDRAVFEAAAKERPRYKAVEKAFGDASRLYLRISDEGSRARRDVAAALAAFSPGYTITDWNGGYATDAAGRQRYRIGALLAKAQAPVTVVRAFENRITDRLMMVVSRDPLDLARASTNRAWVSCAGAKGALFGAVCLEVGRRFELQDLRAVLQGILHNHVRTVLQSAVVVLQVMVFFF